MGGNKEQGIFFSGFVQQHYFPAKPIRFSVYSRRCYYGNIETVVYIVALLSLRKTKRKNTGPLPREWPLADGLGNQLFIYTAKDRKEALSNYIFKLGFEKCFWKVQKSHSNIYTYFHGIVFLTYIQN